MQFLMQSFIYFPVQVIHMKIIQMIIESMGVWDGGLRARIARNSNNSK
tara:strand:- start:339 stop:482 length:144 start_codon:yes stop_codon:yes gene_type:complete